MATMSLSLSLFEILLPFSTPNFPYYPSLLCNLICRMIAEIKQKNNTCTEIGMFDGKYVFLFFCFLGLGLASQSASPPGHHAANWPSQPA